MVKGSSSCCIRTDGHGEAKCCNSPGVVPEDSLGSATISLGLSVSIVSSSPGLREILLINCCLLANINLQTLGMDLGMQEFSLCFQAGW
jgi:hypothetical protein